MWIQILSKLYNLNHYNCIKMCDYPNADDPFRVRMYNANITNQGDVGYVEFLCKTKADSVDLYNRIKKRTLGIVDTSKFD